MMSEAFLRIGNLYTKATSNKNTNLRRFKSFFGVSPVVCALTWDIIKFEAPSQSAPNHLLWCLYFLKQYPTEHEMRSLFKADEKTIRKWIWIFLKMLSNLNVVGIFKYNNSTFDDLFIVTHHNDFFRYIGKIVLI